LGIPHQADSNNELHPLGFFSRKLNDAEINYKVHDKEMLAIMESFNEFRPWLSGTVIPVSIVMDHKNLEYFMTSCHLNRWQACWLLELAEYNFKLSWAPGSKNPADPPSRRPDYVPQDRDSVKNVNHQVLLKEYHIDQSHQDSPSPLLPSSPFLTITIIYTIDTAVSVEEFKTALASDSSWHEASECQDTSSTSCHKDWSQVDDLVLFCDQIYVPPSLRTAILWQHHNYALAGHPGCAKTIELIARDYYWPGLSKDVCCYV